MSNTTMRPLFIQIHTLTSYPATLLNRDDQGFAKRLPFGGATRTRVSSQCLKRHWRTFRGEHSLASLESHLDPVDLSIRSRHTFELFVVEPLIREGVSPELARAATEAVMVAVLGESAKAKKAKEDAKTAPEEGAGPKKSKAKPSGDASDARLVTGQVTVLGKPELDFFLQEAKRLVAAAESLDGMEKAKKEVFTKEWGKNLAGLKRAAGLDAALFGRMVTSSKLARADAALHVAHAFTVHAEHSETDYFSAMDDLLSQVDEGEMGSGHIGNTELSSGLFYGYVVVDVAQLVSNLEACPQAEWRTADRTLAADVVRRLVHLVSTVSPGAKLGSTAPHSFAHFVMAEVGAAQPRTLANAFLRPTSPSPDLLANAYQALASYTTEVDRVYGLDNARALAVVGVTDAIKQLGAPATVSAVADFSANAVLELTP